MVTFEDISIDVDYNSRRILNRNKYDSMDDIYCHNSIGGVKISGFKYYIIGWNHFYNFKTGDYDVVFEGSPNFLSITTNRREEYMTLTERSESFYYYNMKQLSEDCEPILP